VAWTVFYHPEVQDDFRRLGRTEARVIQNVIDERLARGEPEKSGKPLSGDLSGYRRLRTGQTRIVYRVDGKRIEVLVIAVGQRRDDEVYEKAERRARKAKSGGGGG
jgi:mRNA interferase RelE/StbE